MKESLGGRKVVWHGDKEETPEFVKLVHERQKLPTYSPSPEVLALRERLSNIDFEVLREIFFEIYARYGLDSSTINFFEIENIGANPGYGFSSAEFDPQSNLLGINLSQADAMFARLEINPDIGLLFVLTHEQTHAVGRVECHFYSESLDHDSEQRVGFAIKKTKGVKEEYYFYWFNEALTDLIAYEVLSEYIKRTKRYSEEDLERLIRSRNVKNLGEMHLLLEGFVSRLTQATGRPKEEVLEALKKEYFSGDAFFEPKYRDYLESILGEEYISQLSEGKIKFNKRESQRSKSEQWLRDCKAFFLKLNRKIKRN